MDMVWVEGQERSSSGVQGRNGPRAGVSGARHPEGWSRAARLWRASKPRRVGLHGYGLGQGAGTPFVVGAGTRESMPVCRGGAFAVRIALQCISAHFAIS
jgi:hypothetical protein